MSDLLATEKFDNAMLNGSITDDRGGVYGHPVDNFQRIIVIQKVLEDCQHPTIRHALNMIAVKMARLCQTPTGDEAVDSALDIAGYARTICMLLDAEKKSDERKSLRDLSRSTGRGSSDRE